MVDRDLGRVDLRRVGQQPKLRVRLERIGDPMRHPFWRCARRQDQIDVNRHGRRRRNVPRRRLCEERLSGRGKGVSLDPHQLFSREVENSHARQRHWLGKHADEEKSVFDVVHTVVAADDLSLMNRADQERGRPPVILGRHA